MIVKKIYNNSLFRFLIVGFLGTINNLLIFFILADLFDIHQNISAVIAFISAVSQNYLINHLWSFKKEFQEKISLYYYFKYFLVNIAGLIINLIVLNTLMYFIEFPYKVIYQVFAIMTGTLANYIGSRYFVFIKSRNKSNDQK